MSALNEFDIGSLIWVKDEIDLALKRANENIIQYNHDIADTAQLKFCLTHLHQVTGALQMVGLEGAAQFSKEIEALIEVLEKQEKDNITEITALAASSIKALNYYIADLANGQLNISLKLFPLYEGMKKLRGTQNVSEAELFYPNLNIAYPTTNIIVKEKRVEDPLKHIKLQRARFEQGLLKWLRNLSSDGLAIMRQSLEETLSVQTTVQGKLFWWATVGFVEALINNGLDPNTQIKQVFARINSQLGKFAEGNPMIAERLFREILYFVACSKPVTETIQLIKQLYELEELLPETAETLAANSFERALPQQVLRELNEFLTDAKNAWAKTTASPDKLFYFNENIGKLQEKLTSLKIEVLEALVQRIQAVIARIEGDPQCLTEPLALEIATSLLLIETALTDYPDLSAELKQQIEVMGQRLKLISEGSQAIPEVPLLDEISRKAHEKLLLAQVMQEIQTNLSHIEQVLDAFFRDPNQRAELIELEPFLKQISGALNIVDLQKANSILEASSELINQYVDPGYPVDQSELEFLAEALSSLGFYIDAVRYDRNDQDTIIEPILARIPARVTELKQEPAELEVVELLQTESAENVLLDAFLSPVEELAVAEPSMAAPSQDIEVKAPPMEEEVIDAELLAIYLEEAQEVLNSISTSMQLCITQPHNREALTVVRRNFHTLKGSGRMVGLNDLGEVAWEVECLMNEWLQDEKSASPELIETINLAHQHFSHWVKELKESGRTNVEAARLLTQIAQLRQGSELLTPDAIVPEEPKEQVAAEVLESLIPEPELVKPEPVSEITIGGVTLSLSLFEIFSQEAQDHLAVLKAKAKLIKDKEEDRIDREALHAIHTLSGIANTAGFVFLGNLGCQFELWLQDLAKSSSSLTVAQITLIEEVTLELSRIIEAIQNKRLPTEMSKIDTLLNRVKVIREAGLAQEKAQISQEKPQTQNMLAEALESQIVPAIPLVDQMLPPVSLSKKKRKQAKKALAQDKITEEAHRMASQEVENVPFMPVESTPLVEGTLPLTKTEETQALDFDEKASVVANVVDQVDLPINEVLNLSKIYPQTTPTVHDDIDEQLLSVFLEEAHDLVPQVSKGLREWKEKAGDQKASQFLLRLLHTLKGSARMAGAMRLGEAAHSLETRVLTIVESGGKLSPAFFEELNAYIDEISDLLDNLHRPSQLAESQQVKPPVEQVVEQENFSVIKESEVDATSNSLRIKAELVDHLVNQSGEVSIARSRIEAEILAFKNSLADLTENVSRLRSQLREIEIQAETQMQSRLSKVQEEEEGFDPLEFDRFSRLQELTRIMAESVNDVATIHQNFLKNLDETDAALLQQERMNRDLQQSLMSIRMVPLSSISERLYRVARQTGKDLAKKINLEIEGSRVELDRSVLEKITSPLEHMLRNSIDHGIESKEERAKLGKQEVADIRLLAKQEGNELVIIISDDGRGFDLKAIRSKAIEKKLMNEKDKLPDPQLMQFIFSPGFSTAKEVTQLSGRGIGLDVVKSEVSSLGGRIEVSFQAGKGATFTIHLPLTLAVTQVVLIRVGGKMYAIPSTMIEQVQEFKPQALEALYQKKEVRWLNNVYPLFYLPYLLNEPNHAVDNKRYNTVVLLRSGTQRVAVHVDELIKNQEVVVKRVGPQFTRIMGMAGATVLGNGEIVLIINPVELANREGVVAGVGRASDQPMIHLKEDIVAAPWVMVVDDSLTVRKITGRLLTREGYQVKTAKDGVDALQQLQDELPDVMLVDIEMPRMDGFELVRNIRGNAKTKHIPVIMITSRTAEKHRNYAEELGVNAFLGKPYQEEQLLENIAQLLKRPVMANKAH